MKVLIIGSKGFIGSHCLNYFRQAGNTVFGCDVVADYTEARYFLLDASNSNFDFIFQAQQFDVCINCSGAALVSDSISNPSRDFQLNTVNVFLILDAVRRHNNTCKFINLSSAAVYGNPDSLPVAENAVLHPLSPYGWHKLYAENICREFYISYALPVCWVRIFSAYGNGLQKQLFWDIYKKTVAGNDIELYGTGKESRDFIFIDDVVKAIALIVEKGDFNACAYNVSGGIETTIEEAAVAFFAALQWKGSWRFNSKQKPGDPLNWRADISKIEKLGYTPAHTIQQGLQKYAAWVKEIK